MTTTDTRTQPPYEQTERARTNHRHEHENTGTSNGREASGADRSVTSLIRELRDETELLIRQECSLALTEMKAKADRLLRHSQSAAVAGALALAGLIIVLFGAAVLAAWLMSFVLSPDVAAWVGPLLVGGLCTLIGYAMMRSSINATKRESVTPQQTKQSLEETQNWLKDKVK